MLHHAKMLSEVNSSWRTERNHHLASYAAIESRPGTSKLVEGLRKPDHDSK